MLTSLKVGLFLAIRQIRRTSRWTNVLVIAVMVFTFLNLVTVTGILVGMIEGVGEKITTHYLSNLFVSTPTEKLYIEQSQSLIKAARAIPGVVELAPRYLKGGIVSSDYKRLTKPTEKITEVSTVFVGINPAAEDQVTRMSDLVIEGQYLAPDDFDQVLVGAMLLRQYLDFESPDFPVLENVAIGSKVRVEINGSRRVVTVKGIVKSKVDQIDRRIFFVDSQFRSMIGRTDLNVNEIAVKLTPGTSAEQVKKSLIAQGYGEVAKIQTPADAEPKFVKDLKQTFSMLGNVISSISLAVAAITIFIVIFINAITRRKYIGIMKGIGIKTLAIESSYVFQSIFYALIGTAIGAAFVFGFLEPFVRAHPIDFPFSDGILVVTPLGTIVRIIVLLITTLIAGYIPAKIITRQNTVDAILNR